MTENIKNLYRSPELEIIDLSLESGFCSSNPGGNTPGLDNNTWN